MGSGCTFCWTGWERVPVLRGSGSTCSRVQPEQGQAVLLLLLLLKVFVQPAAIGVKAQGAASSRARLFLRFVPLRARSNTEMLWLQVRKFLFPARQL